MRPEVEDRPNKLLSLVGVRTEKPVSLPSPAVANEAARPAPVPALDQPGMRSSAKGLSVEPPSVLAATMSGDAYQSLWLTLARMMAPAARSFLMMVASCVGFTPLSGR